MWRVLCGLCLGIAFAPGVRSAADVATLGNAVDVVAGSVTSIPIYVRDVSASPLGVDQPAGARIQGLAFRVDFPAAAVSAASVVPSGITTGLTAAFGPTSGFAPGSVNYLVAYNESSNPIPFVLDAPAEGNEVATIQLTVHPGQAPGNVVLTLNAVSELSNQAGTLFENVGNGGLVLVAGSIQVLSNAPTGLYARAQSPTGVRLWWQDPQAIETGFRVQRSLDGSNWTDVADLGPDDVSYLAGGLASATLYYWRVLTRVGADLGGASNRATATTPPAVSPQVCAEPFEVSRRWARSPDVVHDGSGWTMVFQSRDDGVHDQIRMLRLDDSTLAPQGAGTQLSNSATGALFAAVGWNGARYAVTWIEQLRGPPGTPLANSLQFMRVEANGIPRRGPRPLETGMFGVTGFNEIVRPHWDGSHWGVFVPEQAPGPQFSLRFRRLDEDGNTSVATLITQGPGAALVSDVEAAWQPLTGEYGVIWLSRIDDDRQLLFQRVEESSGATLLGDPAVVASWTEWGAAGGTSLIANPAGGWLAAWTACGAEDCPQYTRRISAAGVPDAGGPVQISDPGFVETRPRLARRGGGFALYVDVSPNELGRYLLDGAGLRVGGPEQVSTFDGRTSGRSRVASDGTRILAAWSESLTTLEVAGRLAGGDDSLGPIVAFTSGHDVGNTTAVFVPGQPRIAPLAGGHVSLWTESIGGSNHLAMRLHAADGSVIANELPFAATGSSNRPGLAAVGASFAVAWRAPGSLLRFTRRAADNTVLVAETTIATGVGNGPLELGWDGERYMIVYAQGSAFRFLRVDAAGAPIGTPQNLGFFGTVNPSGLVRLEWLGDGWALAWRDGVDNGLVYARIAADGSVLQQPVVFAPPVPPFGAGDLSIAYDGSELGVLWNGFVGADPPFNELHFTVVARDGTPVFAPAILLPGGAGATPPQLHVMPGGFRVVHISDGENFTGGLQELQLQRTPGGVDVTASRYLAHRASGNFATVHDGQSLALAWRVPSVHDIWIENDVCLADPSPPPCPAPALAAANHAVRIAWPAVADPQSGILAYLVRRDGKLIAELPADATQYDDSGHDTDVVHDYRVEAMNRAFQPSQACPVHAWSTTVGDGNGNGLLEVADIFYLNNFLLASGPPPAGDADANGDGIVSAADIFFVINFFFGGGPPPTGGQP